MKKKRAHIRHKSILSILLLFVLFGMNILPASAESKKTVKVGYYENDTFMSGASDKAIKSGYSYEYMRRLQTYTNWDYEYVYGDYVDLYNKLVSGDIDVLTGLAYRDDRKDIIGYPKLAMGDTPYSFLKKIKNTEITSDPKTVAGKKIGVVEGAMESIVTKYLNKNNISAKIVKYNDVKARDKALLEDKVDITIVEGNGTGAMDGVEAFEEAGSTDYFVCTSIKKKDLLVDLNKAQSEMFKTSPDLKEKLNNKWFKINAVSTSLSDDEKAWLKKHKTFTVGYFDNYLPYSSTDENGKTTGVIKDLIPKIFENLNVKDINIQYKPFGSYTEISKALKNNEIDACFPTFGNYWTNEKYGVVPTDSFISTYYNLIYKGKYPDMEKATIALRSNNAMVNEFKNVMYPNAKSVECETVEETLDAVESGKADATLVSGLRTDYYVRLSSRYKNLNVAQVAGEAPLALAVSEHESGTLNILNHGIRLLDEDYALTQSYKYEMKHETTFFEYLRDHIWIPLLLVAVIVGIIITFMARELHKNRVYLAKELKRKKEKEAVDAIVSSLSSMYFTTIAIDVNTGKLDVLRIPEETEKLFKVDGLTFNEVKDTFIRNSVAPQFQDEINEFLEFETLEDRIEEMGYLQKNYLGLHSGWCRMTLVPVLNADTEAVEKIVFAIASIDAEKKREERIRYKAEHDELTGVLNRTAFTQLEDNLKDNDSSKALMIMDVDYFKSVNDTYGHTFGDAVLQHVAHVLMHSFRKSDDVVRYGGDEFIILFADYSDGFEERVIEKVKKINDTLSHPVSEEMPPVTVSAGVTCFDGAYDETVFKHADIALYQTKLKGRKGCTFYKDDMSLEQKK